MVTKNIAITEEAYNLLRRYKRPEQSFSIVIKEHFKKKKHLADYAGIWVDVPEDSWKELVKQVENTRTRLSKSIKKRREELKL